MTIQSKAIKGHFAALFTIIVWGSTFVATKVLLRQFGAVEIIFLRLAIVLDNFLKKETDKNEQ